MPKKKTEVDAIRLQQEIDQDEMRMFDSWCELTEKQQTSIVHDLSRIKKCPCGFCYGVVELAMLTVKRMTLKEYQKRHGEEEQPEDAG